MIQNEMQKRNSINRFHENEQITSENNLGKNNK